MQGTRGLPKPFSVLRQLLNTIASNVVLKQGVPIDGTVRAVALGKAAYSMCEAERTNKLPSSPIRQPRFCGALYMRRHYLEERMGCLGCLFRGSVQQILLKGFVPIGQKPARS